MSEGDALRPLPGGPGEPVVVWGAGAMGGSVGAWLHRAGREVLLVDRDREHVEAIRARGLEIRGPVDAFTRRIPTATPDEVEGRFRTVLLAVKAHHTRRAASDLGVHLAADGAVVSVQNGLNEEIIGEVVGPERVVGCFVNFGADVVEPGVIVRGNRGAVVLGEMDGRLTERARELHALLRLFEPDAVLTGNIRGYLWGKLVYGTLLFATALTDAPIADVLDSREHRPTLIALAREVTRVAEAKGVRLEGFDGFDPDAFAPGASDPEAGASLDRLVAFNRASAKARSGVWRDLAVRKRKTEVDVQIAPIVEHGRKAGVETPLTARLVELIHDVEQGRRSQGWDALDALTSPAPPSSGGTGTAGTERADEATTRS